jgi:small subunit ribosomal protein S18
MLKEKSKNFKKKTPVKFVKKPPLENGIIIDYKHVYKLKKFVSEFGKIMPGRLTGANQQQQKKITEAIKRARFLGLMSYTAKH